MAANPLVLVTRKDDNTQFKVSATKIIYFTALTAGGTYFLYINQRGTTVNTIVNESVSAINTAAGNTQPVTIANTTNFMTAGVIIYINSSDIIYIHSQTWGSRITYNIAGDRSKYNEPPIFIDVLESGATINTAAGNTGIINPQKGKQYWINGNYIDLITLDSTSSPDLVMLYDGRKTEFTKLKLSSNNSYLSIGSSWI